MLIATNFLSTEIISDLLEIFCSFSRFFSSIIIVMLCSDWIAIIISPFSISTIEFNLLMFSTLLLFFCKVMSTTLLLVFTESFENSLLNFSVLSSFPVFLYRLMALITASKLFSFNPNSFIISLDNALRLTIFFERHLLTTKSLAKNVFTCSAMLFCVIKGLNVYLFINLLILCHNAYIIVLVTIAYGNWLI